MGPSPQPKPAKGKKGLRSHERLGGLGYFEDRPWAEVGQFAWGLRSLPHFGASGLALQNSTGTGRLGGCLWGDVKGAERGLSRCPAHGQSCKPRVGSRAGRDSREPRGIWQRLGRPRPPLNPHSPAMKGHMLPTASQASPTLVLAGSMETGAGRSVGSCWGRPQSSLK